MPRPEIQIELPPPTPQQPKPTPRGASEDLVELTRRPSGDAAARLAITAQTLTVPGVTAIAASPPLPTPMEPQLKPRLDPQTLPVVDRKHVMWIMCLLKVITSYDSGAYGAVLGIEDGIASDLQLSVVDEGALGSAPFVGNTIGCIVAGVLFFRSPARPVLLLGMAIHFGGTILFCLSNSLMVALAARTIIGFTLSFVVVYSVVWTDLFAPRAKATTWLAAMNAGVPIGMLIGFVVGGFVIPQLGLSWRFVFLFKAIILLPVVLALYRVPGEHINDPAVVPESEHAGKKKGLANRVCTHVVANTCTLLRNELFVCAVFTLVVLYFVVTAMQVFITSYLRGPPFNANMTTIVFGFGATSVTAPVLGVVAGGVILDRLGGYQSNLRRAAIFGAACGTLAAWFALLACFMTTVPTFIAALWGMLFVGAANVPTCTGILMASVPPSMRSTASSYAAVAFNVFGYFMGPIACGFLADQTGSLRTAFHIILMCSGLGCIPLGLAIVFSASHKAAERDEEHATAHETRSKSASPAVSEAAAATVVEGSFVVSVPGTPGRNTPLQRGHSGPSFDVEHYNKHSPPPPKPPSSSQSDIAMEISTASDPLSATR